MLTEMGDLTIDARRRRRDRAATTTTAHQALLGAPAAHIAGGSDEVMKNIIGERVLGLPGEPRARQGRRLARSPPLDGAGLRFALAFDLGGEHLDRRADRDGLPFDGRVGPGLAVVAAVAGAERPHERRGESVERTAAAAGTSTSGTTVMWPSATAFATATSAVAV